MSKVLHQWRKCSTKDEWEKLADLSGTSAGYLNQVAYGNRTPSSALAKKIEKAAATFVGKPLLTKEELVFGE